MMTTVAHLGISLRAMDLNVLRLERHGTLATAANERRLHKRLRHIHLRDAVAEFIRLGPLQLHGPFSDNRSLMPTGASRFQLAENAVQQFALKERVCFGSELERTGIGIALQPLAFRHFAGVVFDKLLQLLQLAHIAWFRILARAGPYQ